MRPNYSHNAMIASNRNTFIEMMKNKESVIIINAELLRELETEISGTRATRKLGKFFTKASLPMMLFASTPIGLLCSGILLCTGIVTSITNGDFKKYRIYYGVNEKEEKILVFHRKSKVDLKYDNIIYPEWVLAVKYSKKHFYESKNLTQHIKIK